MTPKPWGAETLWAQTETYAAKILDIEAGQRTSLQHHVRKTETLLVLEGRVLAHIEDEALTLIDRQLGPGDTLHVPAGRRHRLTAFTRARLVEVSSPELADVVRHADDYGRAAGAPSVSTAPPLATQAAHDPT